MSHEIGQREERRIRRQQVKDRYVSDNYLSWVILHRIELTHLVFAAESITDQTERLINSIDLSNLIYIKGEFYVNDDIIMDILKQRTPSLTILDISECGRHITDSSVIPLAKGLPQLKELSLSGTEITGDSLIEISKNLKELESLEIWRCGGIEMETFGQMDVCPCLIHFWALDVDIDDNGLKRLAISCPSLKELFIGFSGCLVTDDGVIPLVQICGGTLAILHVRGASQVSDKSLTAVANHCPELLELDFGGCYIRETSCFKSLARGCKKLTILSVLEQPWVNIESIPIVISFLKISLREFSCSIDVIAGLGDEDKQNQYFDNLNDKFPKIKFEVL